MNALFDICCGVDDDDNVCSSNKRGSFISISSSNMSQNSLRSLLGDDTPLREKGAVALDIKNRDNSLLSL